MQLIIYPFIVCVGIFLIQLFFIIRKNKIVYNDIWSRALFFERSGRCARARVGCIGDAGKMSCGQRRRNRL